MSKKSLVIVLVALTVIVPLAIFGCKAKVEKQEVLDTSAAMPETTSMSGDALATPEPAQVVATETIPPSAAPQVVSTSAAVPQQTIAQDKEARNKEIQTALKNAGFYTGSIDGKLGPRTKKAIEEFQKAKELKVDGKVGPKTWAELDKYLAQQ